MDKRIDAINKHTSAIHIVKREYAIKNNPGFCIIKNLENENKLVTKMEDGRKEIDIDNSFWIISHKLPVNTIIENLPIDEDRKNYLKNLYSIMMKNTCLVLFENKNDDGNIEISEPLIC